MNREKLLQLFAIFMIVGFALEIVLISIPQGSNFAPTPTPGSGPTPTPVPEFVGSAVADAKVVAMGRRVLARCNTTVQLGPILQNIEGVSSAVFDPASMIADISLGENATVSGGISAIRNTLALYCQPVIFQQAHLSFEGNIVFDSATEENKTKSFPGRILDCPTDSFTCYAFVLPNRKAGSNVSVDVLGRFAGNVPSRLFIQEQASASSAEFVTTYAQGRVSSLQNEGIAYFDIPWEKRDVNVSRLQEELSGGNWLQNQVSYSADNTVRVEGNYSNDTIAALRQSPLFTSVGERDGYLLLLVASDAKDKNAIRMALANQSINTSAVQFADSKMAIKFSYTVLEEGLAPLRAKLGPESNVLRYVNVRLLDPLAAEEGLGAAWAQKEDGLTVLVPLNVTFNQTLNLSISAATLLGSVNDFGVQWAGN